jgi:hypothetical protein
MPTVRLVARAVVMRSADPSVGLAPMMASNSSRVSSWWAGSAASAGAGARDGGDEMDPYGHLVGGNLWQAARAVGASELSGPYAGDARGI